MDHKMSKELVWRRTRAIAKPLHREEPMRLSVYAALLAVSLTYLFY